MVPIENNNHRLCQYRNHNKCTNTKIANGIVVNDSLQSKYYCSVCEYFKPTEELKVEATVD